MRNFLFSLGGLFVGGATGMAALTLLGPPPPGEAKADLLLPAALFWLLTLLVGLVLSAPAVLAPPAGGRGLTFRLPWPLWIAFMVFKLVVWTGQMILFGVWWLIFLVLRPLRPTSPGPGVPQLSTRRQPAVPGSVPGPGAPAPAPATSPSWHRDPTGRYAQRFWDGKKWTPHVANGTMTAIDPLQPR